MPDQALLAADRGGLYPLDRADPALPSRDGRGMKIVGASDPHCVAITLKDLENHLKLKPG